MAIYIHYFETENEYQDKRANEYEEPWTSYVEEERRVNYNKTEYEKPLTFEITSNGNITWKTDYINYAESIEYKKNNGEWTEITSTTEGTNISVVSGDIVRFRGNNDRYMANTHYNYFRGTTCGFKLKGNIMSLIDSYNFTTATTLVSSYTFGFLFRDCTGLTDASELILPATTLATYCYDGMFYGCTNLTQAPELPATTLANGCYVAMFYGCTNLTQAPALPATTLVTYCYYNMFNSCTNLNYIKCLATDISASRALETWVSGVASSGTFVKSPNITTATWTTGVNGIPTNWTVQDAS